MNGVKIQNLKLFVSAESTGKNLEFNRYGNKWADVVEKIEVLKNKLAVSPLDVDVEEKDEEPMTAPPVVIDPFDVIIKELKDQEEWIADFVRQTKPKKKINKKQIQRDIFEIDFMCD
jgi:hypothetical protein